MSRFRSVRMTVEPFALQRVKKEHVAGVFGCLTDVIQARIELLEQKRSTTNAERIRFWQFALQNLDLGVHESIQLKYLVSGTKIRISGIDNSVNGGLYPDMVKYIDPIEWLESKLRLCREIGLCQSAPLTILDIGTGPGHFPFAARFYGHDVFGLDLPHEVNEDGQTFLYDDLCNFYGVRRIAFNITTGCELPSIGNRCDLVTSFLTAFNAVPTAWDPNGIRRIWGSSDWESFLASCFRTWLKDDGRLILGLTRDKLTDDTWDFLCSRADKVNVEKLRLEISRVSAGIG